MNSENHPQPPAASQINSWKIAEVPVNCDGVVRNLYLFDTKLGHDVFKDVLTGQAYPLHPSFGDVSTIVDIGANIGLAAVFFAINYPEARILSFEPSPLSYSLLVKNTGWTGKIETFNFGLADQDRQALLYSGKQDPVTNSICLNPENTSESVQVPVRNARAVLSERSVEAIDILKLDTEGCEVPILRSLAEMFSRIGVIFVEYHSEEDRLEIDRLLADTHILFSGKIDEPHRGELCYLAKSRLPSGFYGKQILKTF